MNNYKTKKAKQHYTFLKGKRTSYQMDSNHKWDYQLVEIGYWLGKFIFSFKIASEGQDFILFLGNCIEYVHRIEL